MFKEYRDHKLIEPRLQRFAEIYVARLMRMKRILHHVQLCRKPKLCAHWKRTETFSGRNREYWGLGGGVVQFIKLREGFPIRRKYVVYVTCGKFILIQLVLQ